MGLCITGSASMVPLTPDLSAYAVFRVYSQALKSHPERSTMRIVGTVVEETSGKPLAGLQVRAFDKDLIFDDKLGTAVTDEAGRFRMDYSSLDFSLLGGWRRSRALHSSLRRGRQEAALYKRNSNSQRPPR